MTPRSSPPIDSITEWELQEILTDRWLRTGIPLGSERLLLVAWEVMFDSWTINDSTADWTKPSIDFIALDETGGLVCIELKRRITGRKPVWSALAQVTRRALLMSRSYSPANLRQAYSLCRSGDHGRTASNRPAAPLEDASVSILDVRARPPAETNPPIRRVLAMTGHGPSLHEIVETFNSQPLKSILSELARLYPSDSGHGAREIRRLREMSAAGAEEDALATPVELMVISE